MELLHETRPQKKLKVNDGRRKISPLKLALHFIFLFSMFFLYTLSYESCRAIKKQTLNQGKDKDGNRKILKISAKLFKISSFPFLRLSTLCKDFDLTI